MEIRGSQAQKGYDNAFGSCLPQRLALTSSKSLNPQAQVSRSTSRKLGQFRQVLRFGEIVIVLVVTAFHSYCNSKHKSVDRSRKSSTNNDNRYRLRTVSFHGSRHSRLQRSRAQL